jgi:hypothetical protein
MSTGEYVLHEISAYGEMNINESSFNICYATGQSYYNNDYSTPDKSFDICADNCDMIILDICRLLESDIKEESDAAKEVQEKYELTNAQLLEAYELIEDSKPVVSDYIDTDIYTYDLNDYDENEETNELTLKAK